MGNIPRGADLDFESNLQPKVIIGEFIIGISGLTEGVLRNFTLKYAPFLEISIHGANDRTAELLNQVPGSHTRLLHTLQLLRQRGVRVFLKCVVTRLVENELDEIRAVGDRFDYPVYFDPILTLSDDGESYPLELQASEAALKHLYTSNGLNIGNSPFERKEDMPTCGVAMGTLSIDPYGNVSPCIQWKESVGNLRHENLQDIWTLSQELERIREINRHMAQSLEQATPDHSFCGHCPGLSQLRYGDPTRPEEQYLRVARIRRQVAEEEAASKKVVGDSVAVVR